MDWINRQREKRSFACPLLEVAVEIFATYAEALRGKKLVNKVCLCEHVCVFVMSCVICTKLSERRGPDSGSRGRYRKV